MAFMDLAQGRRGEVPVAGKLGNRKRNVLDYFGSEAFLTATAASCCLIAVTIKDYLHPRKTSEM